MLSQPTFCLLERLRATQKASIGFGASYLATSFVRYCNDRSKCAIHFDQKPRLRPNCAIQNSPSIDVLVGRRARTISDGSHLLGCHAKSSTPHAKIINKILKGMRDVSKAASRCIATIFTRSRPISIRYRMGPRTIRD